MFPVATTAEPVPIGRAFLLTLYSIVRGYEFSGSFTVPENVYVFEVVFVVSALFSEKVGATTSGSITLTVRVTTELAFPLTSVCEYCTRYVPVTVSFTVPEIVAAPEPSRLSVHVAHCST